MSDLKPPNPTPDLPEDIELFAGRIPLKRGRSLREHSARGTVINTVFAVGMTTMGLVRGFIVAGFLATEDYGVYGLLIIGLGMLLFLKQFGIADKYVQQAEEDQEVEFQKAWTLEVIVVAALTVLLFAATPLIALVYDEPRLLAAGWVSTLGLPLMALTFPLYIFYRRMEFMKQRLIQAIDPVVGLIASVALAVAGAGYWALILGAQAGLVAVAVVTVIMNPYKLRLRYDRGTFRRYWSFSWPLFVNGVAMMLMAQAVFLVGRWEVGVAGLGAITLATNISQYTDRVDGLITGTLYPGICAVAKRTELLFEIFVKSNRLTLMWGIPFGVALSVFAADLVHFGLGDEWETAIFPMQVFGLTAAAGHIGFNWDAFYRARGQTRPIAVHGVIVMVTMLSATIPLTIVGGIKGYALGMAIVATAVMSTRAYFLARLFGGFVMLRHALRAIKPTIPAVVVVLGLRAAESGERTLTLALGELALYLAVTVAATYYFERPLLREAIGYVRRTPAEAAAA
jgi:O-antigen/teichoic acid export membrane protein